MRRLIVSDIVGMLVGIGVSSFFMYNSYPEQWFGLELVGCSEKTYPPIILGIPSPFPPLLELKPIIEQCPHNLSDTFYLIYLAKWLLLLIVIYLIVRKIILIILR